MLDASLADGVHIMQSHSLLIAWTVSSIALAPWMSPAHSRASQYSDPRSFALTDWDGDGIGDLAVIADPRRSVQGLATALEINSGATGERIGSVREIPYGRWELSVSADPAYDGFVVAGSVLNDRPLASVTLIRDLDRADRRRRIDQPLFDVALPTAEQGSSDWWNAAPAATAILRAPGGRLQCVVYLSLARGADRDAVFEVAAAAFDLENQTSAPFGTWDDARGSVVRSVAVIGDADGDGWDDLAVALGHPPHSRERSGNVVVVSGQSGAAIRNISCPADAPRDFGASMVTLHHAASNRPWLLVGAPGLGGNDTPRPNGAVYAYSLEDWALVMEMSAPDDEGPRPVMRNRWPLASRFGCQVLVGADADGEPVLLVGDDEWRVSGSVYAFGLESRRLLWRLRADESGAHVRADSRGLGGRVVGPLSGSEGRRVVLDARTTSAPGPGGRLVVVDAATGAELLEIVGPAR